MIDSCKAKAFYDTEFEAERAAAIAGHGFGAEMEAYLCPRGKHYHIANKKRALRNKFAKQNTYCEPCQAWMRSSRYQKHIFLPAHIARAKQSKVGDVAVIDQEANDDSRYNGQNQT